MKEESLFQQMRFVRKRSLASLDATTEEVADAKPEGFLNNIRWNFGHIFVSQENLLARFTGEEAHMPEGYIQLFHGGTSPDEWPEEVPRLADLRKELESQTERLIQTYGGRLSEEGEKPFDLGGGIVFRTLDEVLNFTIWHEGLHQGTISALKRSQGVENLF
ncbi:DinB family protein [Halobacillus sp. Nhm2S1]|uniref:DinB family protein n=1 Tax=Halobacillus sp. Nhm2S1 TaxID=2866716 RepID=UPI001C72B217|nr:DinB family protein [Halobacillus sp. Nhm2S1]MBX0356128.1 DinB family protein [Halobacillus sp. Nhm2S1]